MTGGVMLRMWRAAVLLPLLGLGATSLAAGPLDAVLARTSSSPVHPISITDSRRGAVATLPGMNQGIMQSYTDVYSGNLFTQWVVLSAEGAPARWDIALEYNSQLSDEVGVLGPGWRFSYDIQLEIGVPTPAQATVRWGDGRIDPFDPDGSGWLGAPDLMGTRIQSVAGGYELTTKHRGRYRFGADGRLEWIADRHDRKLTLARDQLGRITNLTDADGRSAMLTYDGSGRLAQIAGLLSAPEVMTYDGLGRLVQVDGPAGRRGRFQYDAENRLVRMWDPRDVPVTIDYVVPGPGAPPVVAWARDPLRFRMFYWNADSLVTAVFDSLGPGVNQEVRYHFDVLGRVIGVSDAARGTYACAYDPTGLTSYTDSDGHTWSWLRDGLGNATRLTEPTGAVWRATYDPTYNVPLTLEDPLAQTWSATYTAFGDRLTTRDPLGDVHAYDYDGLGRLVRHWDPLGHETDFTWDPLSGGLQSARDPLGFTVNYTRNVRGVVTSVTDQEGQAWTYARDALDRLVQLVPPAPAGPWSYDWTPSGRLAKTTDPLGHTKRWTYDAADRLVRLENEVGALWRFDWDGGDGLLLVTDPIGSTETRTVDRAGRPLSRLSPEGDVWRCTWLGDEPASVIGPEGGITQIQFTPRHQLSRVATGGAVNTYTYDAAARLVGAKRDYPAEPTVAYLLTRDAAGRVTGEQELHLGRSTTYTLDAAGRVVQVLDNLGGVPVPITWDDRDEPVSMLLPGHPDPVGTHYSARGLLQEVDYGAGMSSTYAHDAAGRLTALVNATPSWLATYVLTRDGSGDVTRLDTTTPGTGPLKLDMTCDPAHRLTSEAWSDGTPSRFYSYDAVGNRTSVADPLVTPYVYSSGHRLLSAGALAQTWGGDARVHSWQVPPAAPFTHTYTPDRFLSGVDQAPFQWRFLYGPFGELVRLDEPTAGAHWYAYDGQDRLIRRVDLPAPATAPRVEQYYGSGPRLDVEVRPVADHWNSYLQNFQPLFTDPAGSVAQYAESTSVLVSERWYEPFGVPHFSGGSPDVPDRGYRAVPTIPRTAMYLITSYGTAQGDAVRQHQILGEVLRAFDPKRVSFLPLSISGVPPAVQVHAPISSYLPSTGSVQADGSFGPDFIAPPWTGPGLKLPEPIRLTLIPPRTFDDDCPLDYSSRTVPQRSDLEFLCLPLADTYRIDPYYEGVLPKPLRKMVGKVIEYYIEATGVDFGPVGESLTREF